MLLKLKLTLCSCVVLYAFAASTSSPAQQDAKSGKRTLIRAGHLLDVKTGKLSDAQTIVVVGESIQSIGATASVSQQPGDEVIDLGGATVLPGLMDVHTHLTMNPDFDPFREVTSTSAKEAINGVVNARKTLMSGFTTVRNVGAGGFTDVDLRDAVNAGQVAGPHMLVSGPAMGITGGHCDDNLLPAQYHSVGDGVADGIAQVQHKVRENIKYGADVIKICATGGVLSKGDDPQASQYTLEEMQAIVADAHRLGRKVAAHAHGAQGILWASEAGVDSIEHGSYIDDAAIAMMKKHGTYLVPTLYLEDWQIEKGQLPAFYHKKMVDVSSVAKQNIKHAMQSGVKIALGTDAAVYPHGLNAHEVDVYVNQLGMTPLAALQTATINAADLLGLTAKTGTLEPGKWADIIAVDKNPIDDVRTLQDVKFVMKAGVVYKQNGAEIR
ncbi:metal-dependent hydrolase family protein [Occallatibacter savannae]|uniref:metal-dependent hydrolase family protein n=1 Tax=Occallatibacter savannae TaxID=1002691 RepID=UPI000D688383|nr:amidohydrolase family protein [Occallatibacter savannae]